MGENYSKTDLREIAGYLIDDLRECEDGTCITTYQLLCEAGYEDEEFDEANLMEIHAALLKAAKANHITLDMSAHEYSFEGLVYNLDYIVHNKKAQIKCPYCGCTNTARIIYGMPVYSKIQKKLESGKVHIGGCEIDGILIKGEFVQTDPERYCNACKKKFSRPPLLIAKDHSSAEDIRDVVTSINFSYGGYFGGFVDITIRKNDKGALVKSNHTHHGLYMPAEKTDINR